MTPAECTTREDIRREIDRLDRVLVDLLVERFGYIRRMAEIKNDPDEARIDSRVNDVLAKVTALAKERGLDVDLAADLWTTLMDWNIEWERQAIAARANKKAKP
ncbi:MAG: chorismate mutase [Bauldia sp.]